MNCSGGRPLTTADYLYQDCVQDLLPADDQVCEDFWFNRLPKFAEKTKLFGLYKGLWYINEFHGTIPSETLHQWQAEGSLVEHIIESFNTLPERSRGGYFPWFLKNRHIFEGPGNPEEFFEREVASYFEAGQAVLDPEDRGIPIAHLQPQAKMEAIQVFMMGLHQTHPGPEMELFSCFGFCTCRGRHEEQLLGGLYGRLIMGGDALGADHLHAVDGTTTGGSGWVRPGMLQHGTTKQEKCSFTEFWKAYESSKLIDLIDSKGLREYRLSLDLKHLEHYLRLPRKDPHESVWMLSRFIANEESHRAPAPVLVDYGFIHCKSFFDTMDLKEVYKNLLFAADALDLHRACVTGKILEFATKHIKVEERFKSLMRNPYPLPDLE
jgi:hypothetical protein